MVQVLAPYAKPEPWVVRKEDVHPRVRRLRDGLVFEARLWEGGDVAFDYAHNVAATVMQGSWEAYNGGLAFSIAATEEINWAADSDYAIGGDIDFALFVALYKTSTTDTFPGYFVHRTSFSDGMWELYNRISTGDMEFAFHDGTAARTVTFSTLTDLPANAYGSLGLRREVGGTYTLVKNGDERQTVTDTNVPSATTHTVALATLEAGLDAHQQLGRYYVAYIWKHIIPSVNDFALLHEDPFMLYRFYLDEAGAVPAAALLGDEEPWRPPDPDPVPDLVTVW